MEEPLDTMATAPPLASAEEEEEGGAMASGEDNEEEGGQKPLDTMDEAPPMDSAGEDEHEGRTQVRDTMARKSVAGKKAEIEIAEGLVKGVVPNAEVEGGVLEGLLKRAKRPERCVRLCLHAALRGKRALTRYLDTAEATLAMEKLDAVQLTESVTLAYREEWAAPQIKAQALWHFSVVIANYPNGDRIKNLKLAVRGYEELLAGCDSYDHPTEYSALQNSLDLAKIELGTRRLTKSHGAVLATLAPPKKAEDKKVRNPRAEGGLKLWQPAAKIVEGTSLQAQSSKDSIITKVKSGP
jgi:hypothetical protein